MRIFDTQKAKWLRRNKLIPNKLMLITHILAIMELIRLMGIELLLLLIVNLRSNHKSHLTILKKM
jgi:hypothetical protein